MRKTCDELSVHVQAMNVELAEKIDRDSVGFIVHEKYEEIVRYLQDALQSSLEDENKFKQKADEIQEMVILLTNSKADRTEIQHMQELMVKSEALLKKAGSQFNVKDRLKDFVPRKEMELALQTKVDKLEMEKQLQSVIASTKRNRKLASMVADSGVEDILDSSLPLNRRPVVGADSNRPLSTGNIDSEAGQQTSTMLSRSQKTPSGEVAVIALGQGLSPERNQGTRGSRGDFGNFVKGKSKHPAATPTLPNGTQPGQFRNGSEAGRAGSSPPRGRNSGQPGSVAGGVGATQAGDGYGRSEYPFVPPAYNVDYATQSAVTDHMAYLNGPIVGGGFNTHARHLQHATPGGKPVPEDDVEGKGL